MPDQFTLLLEWRRNEAAGRGLAKLPPDYYESTAAYLRELRRSYEVDLRENPSSRKGEISRQTFQRASQVFSAPYTCASVAHTEGKLPPSSRVRSAGDSASHAPSMRSLAQ